MSVRIIQGDVREKLRELPDNSVHCVVTSPPYYGLRDYGTAKWEGGDPDCKHEGPAWTRRTGSMDRVSQEVANVKNDAKYLMITKGVCKKCGAQRVDQQIGLEASPQEFIETLVDVFREIRRVLRTDGTCWVNMGDSYAGSWGAQGRPHGKTGEMATRSVKSARQINGHPTFQTGTGTVGAEWGLKPKDLIGMPWRLALALQLDGWWLRQDIIWSKPNPMPESIKDRCTKAHEYVFLLSKAEKYFYDFGAMQEEASEGTNARRAVVPAGWASGETPHTAVAHQQATQHRKTAGRKLEVPGKRVKSNSSFDEAMAEKVATRNKRSVWTIASEAFPEAHFATFPTTLAETCIKAGCPADGTVLDPFGGAGTTGLVADRLGRNAILIELNPEYAEMARKRIQRDAPLLAEVAAE
jgi:DNA modification methylase